MAYSTNIYIPHGRYHHVRVPRGKFARVWAEVAQSRGHGNESVQPRLLQEGEHCIDSHLFRFVGLSDVSDEHIDHGSIHRISVQKGCVTKVWQDNVPRLLGEGDHLLDSTAFRFDGAESILSSLCIVHGTITILRVTLGQIALVWQDNQPTFIDQPGLFEFDSPDFSFVGFKDAEEQLIQLGAKKIILVHTGQVGVTYDQGRLSILYSGRHVIDSATHVFHRFLSTQQRSIRLATLNAGEKLARQSGRMSSGAYYSSQSRAKQGSKKKEWVDFDEKTTTGKKSSAGKTLDHDADLTVCETKDLVKVGMRADVFYSIEDPEKCIQKIDTEELEDLVRETAVATLTNIIRSTALNEIAQSKAVSVRTTSEGTHILAPPDGGNTDYPPPTAPGAVFFEKVHDEFLSKLNEDFMERYGVDIANIRIESFKIMDEELSEQISKHALTTAQIENEMANLEGKSLISTTQERTAAEVKNIHAEADAAAQKTTADAENTRKVDAALASAESHKIATHAKAEAEADAILMKARAEAEAIRLKATAEAERAEVLSRTALGQQEALLKQYAHMVIESNRGVDKIIYLDPSVNRESPFALGSLQNLNNDLHSLSQLGIASDHQAATDGHHHHGSHKGKDNKVTPAA
jgi:regulator of protease activity HflC (stomatin/prohibitin superfamily)